MPEHALFTEFCIQIVLCSVDKREDAKNYMTGSYSFHHVISARFYGSWPPGHSPFEACFFVFLCLRSWSRRGRPCYFSTLTLIVAETAKHFPRYTVLLLSTVSILLVSFQRWHSPLHESVTTLLFQFIHSGLKNSGSVLSINMSLHHGLQISDCSASKDFD